MMQILAAYLECSFAIIVSTHSDRLQLPKKRHRLKDESSN